MSITVINQGTWSLYTPDQYPAGMPPGVLFAKSDTTGQDWYDALYGETKLLGAGSITLTATKDSSGVWTVVAAHSDNTKTFPGGKLLLEVRGYTGSDPHADFVGKVYDHDHSSVSSPSVNLVAYANEAQWSKATGGYTTEINGQSITFRTDAISMALITGKALRFQQANPPTSVAWQIGPTNFITISAADFITLACNIADFMQKSFDTLNTTVLPGIESGEIKTTAQIDSAFA